MSKRTLTTTPQDWASRLAAQPISKHDLNSLVADYLFTEGYLDAAVHFAHEAGLDPSHPTQDFDSIRARRDIRAAVQRGEIERALDKVVELDPEILDHNPSLHFALLQQHLIELIRQDRLVDALEFAQAELAPRGQEHVEFLDELEKTMALLAFELPKFSTDVVRPSNPATTATSAAGTGPAPVPGKKARTKSTTTTAPPAGSDVATGPQPPLPPMPSSLCALLSPSHRLSTAVSLNSAILAAQGHSSSGGGGGEGGTGEPKLPRLFGVLNWGEGVLSERGVEWDKWDLKKELGNMGGGDARDGGGGGGAGPTRGGADDETSESVRMAL
ncbi:hypothetical protein JCM10212_006860 [Sporobolomyces blumeae]